MKGKIRIALVVAVATNGVIGCNGQLPWRLPTDLKRFRRLTLGKPVIMGRKTYESIGKPLDRRDNVVITRQSDYRPAGVYTASSIDDALTLSEKLATERGIDEIAIIGGQEIFTLTRSRAQRIYLTAVHAAPAGDTYFDAPDPLRWRQSSKEPMVQAPDDQFPADFIVLDRQA